MHKVVRVKWKVRIHKVARVVESEDARVVESEDTRGSESG